MKKFFITGVSGVGKSSVAEKLSQKGIYAIDIDAIEGLCQWVDNDTFKIDQWHPGMTNEWYQKHKYICDKEKLTNLMFNYKDVVVVVGLPSNHYELLGLFDKVFLLQCKEETFIKRLTERTNNDFGKHDLEKENILSWYKNFETKMLKKGAISINANPPIIDVVANIISQF